ncbi:hypothetical protein BJ742DRAFT_843700 [Cladochytrium replicatum]|nr:hypothetical protein BJ742DRAFT_843700 [Cladochytrium replicatum]
MGFHPAKVSLIMISSILIDQPICWACPRIYGQSQITHLFPTPTTRHHFFLLAFVGSLFFCSKIFFSWGILASGVGSSC